MEKLQSMGALEMGLSEDELQPLVTAWRNSNQNIVRFWWDIDRAAMNAVKYHMDGEVCAAIVSPEKAPVSGFTGI